LKQLNPVVVRASMAIVLATGLLQIGSSAQDRLPSMPGYAQFQKISTEGRGAVVSGALRSISPRGDVCGVCGAPRGRLPRRPARDGAAVLQEFGAVKPRARRGGERGEGM